MNPRLSPILLAMIILTLSLTTALTITITCPETVLTNEPFTCNIKVSEGEGTYDVKLELKDGEETIGKIWHEEENTWKSSYYYLQDYLTIEEEKTLQAQITQAGTYQASIKLRQGNKNVNQSFTITAEENPNPTQETTTEETPTKTNKKKTTSKKTTNTKEKETRTLNKEPTITNTTPTPTKTPTIQTINLQSKTTTQEPERVTMKKHSNTKILGIGTLILLALTSTYYLWAKL